MAAAAEDEADGASRVGPGHRHQQRRRRRRHWPALEAPLGAAARSSSSFCRRWAVWALTLFATSMVVLASAGFEGWPYNSWVLYAWSPDFPGSLAPPTLSEARAVRGCLKVRADCVSDRM